MDLTQLSSAQLRAVIESVIESRDFYKRKAEDLERTVVQDAQTILALQGRIRESTGKITRLSSSASSSGQRRSSSLKS